MSSPLIMLEFNELSPTLMEKFIGEGRLPAFASLKRQSIVYTTDAELSPPYLEPWIQWVTVHTGVPYEAHGIFDLSDGHLCSHPRLWDRLAEAGRSSWVCGSMNTGPAPDASELLLLPDPWATGVKPHPPGRLRRLLPLGQSIRSGACQQGVAGQRRRHSGLCTLHGGQRP